MNYLKAFTAQSKEAWALTQNENVTEDILKTSAMALANVTIELPKHCALLSCQVLPSGSFTLYIGVNFGHAGNAMFSANYDSINHSWSHSIKANEDISAKRPKDLQIARASLSTLILAVSDELRDNFSALASVLLARPYKQA